MVIVIVDENTERSAEIAGELRHVAKIYEAGTPQEIETIVRRTGKIDVFFVSSELGTKPVQILTKRYGAPVFVYGDVAPDAIGEFYRAGAKDLFAFPLEVEWVAVRLSEVRPVSRNDLPVPNGRAGASAWNAFYEFAEEAEEAGSVSVRSDDTFSRQKLGQKSVTVGAGPDAYAWKDPEPSAAPERFIVVVSAKGGEGKTTFAVQLGMLMAKKHGRVVLLDIDPNGNAADAVGVEAVDDITGFAAKRHLTEQELLSMTTLHKASGLRILASPVGIFEPLRWTDLKRVIDAYRGLFPNVIVDHTAGITPSLLYLARDYATDVFVMVTPDMTRLQRLLHMLEIMLQQGVSPKKIRVIVNRTRLEGAYRVIQAAVMDLNSEIQVFSLPYHQNLDGRDKKGLTPIPISEPKSPYARSFRDIVGQTLRISIGAPARNTAKAKKQKVEISSQGFWNGLLGLLKISR